MNRDILFAQELQRQCNEEKYVSIINDGCIELDELVNKVVVHFWLGDYYEKEREHIAFYKCWFIEIINQRKG